MQLQDYMLSINSELAVCSCDIIYADLCCSHFLLVCYTVKTSVTGLWSVAWLLITYERKEGTETEPEVLDML
jgi:hypothetical protein